MFINTAVRTTNLEFLNLSINVMLDLSQCCTQHYAMKARGGVEVYLHPFLTSAGHRDVLLRTSGSVTSVKDPPPPPPPPNRSGRFEEEENFLLLPSIDPRFLRRAVSAAAAAAVC